MDIFTHVMIGAAATSPFWITHPLESVAFVLGSVLPDIDALSRQFGKVAYLRAHQTWTHAIPLQLLTTALLGAAVWAAEMPILLASVAALGAGMMLHSLLDVTNTYGVKLFAPFDRRRRYLEWVFFIDAFVVVTTVLLLTGQGALIATDGGTSASAAIIWGVALAGYFGAKSLLRGRAAQALPEAVSLVPSALWPWRFYGLSIDRERATTCTVDAWARDLSHVEHHAVCDHTVLDLEALPEYRAMQELSVGFVPTAADDGRVVCRDLRTRNFGTQFGRLTVNMNGLEPVVERFDV